MAEKLDTIKTEDKYFTPFFNKIKISIEKGRGVYVWDEAGKQYIDFTSGWGVTSIGHASSIITKALTTQAGKIIQNPNSGLTYSPIRAKLLLLLRSILPDNLNRIFFANSGAEVNDAAIKLARKVKGRLNIISSDMSFHGRTISTASATGQVVHRNKFNPLMPNYIFVPYNDVKAIAKVIKDDVAAVILEPIQGEGGVNIPADDYLQCVSELCVKNNALLIIDEIQTGFYRTGRAFASDLPGVKIDFLTMAKGIAGGFPFAAFAVTEEIANKFEIGDHGGTYCGNPLGCSVSYSVIKHMIETNIEKNVNDVGMFTMKVLRSWQSEYPDHIKAVRGKGLLIALVFNDKNKVFQIDNLSLKNGLILNIKHEVIIRFFPALNITVKQMEEGLLILKRILDRVLKN